MGPCIQGPRSIQASVKSIFRAWAGSSILFWGYISNTLVIKLQQMVYLDPISRQ